MGNVNNPADITNIKQAMAILEEFMNENSFIFSDTEGNQTKVTNLVWDKNLNKVEISKESE